METIAVDFDGVVHAWDGNWNHGKLGDALVPGAAAGLRQLLAMGYRLVLFTARARDPAAVAIVSRWLEGHGLAGVFAEVTNQKPPAVAYLDDRAIRFTAWPKAVAEVRQLRPSAPSAPAATPR